MDTNSTSLSIKQLASEDRPREKMLERGKNALTDAELLAILIRSGSRKESALVLAQRILRDAQNDLAKVSMLSVKQLMAYRGVGEAKAITIAAALELGRRRRESVIRKENHIRTSKDAFEYMQSVLTDLTHEQFWIIMLNTSNGIIGRELISEGGISATIVDLKKIFKKVLEHNAVQIIVCHNHPSGNSQPSKPDVQLTKKIKEGGAILDITLVDHIIIGNERYYSFADEGAL